MVRIHLYPPFTITWNINMKLIKKEVGIDDETFQPQMIVTIAIPLEVMQDTNSINQEELEKIYGKEFLNLLK